MKIKRLLLLGMLGLAGAAIGYIVVLKLIRAWAWLLFWGSW